MSDVESNLMQDQAANGVAAVTPPENRVPDGYLPQAEVDRIVGAVKAKTEARVRGEYDAMLQRAEPSNTVDPSSIAKEVFSLVQGELRAKEEEGERLRKQQEFDKFRDSLRQKLQVGINEYQDFEQKVGKFNSAAYGDVLRMAHDLPNTADVMYFLSGDRKKLCRHSEYG